MNNPGESLKACRIRLINLKEHLDTASAASELVFHAYGAIADFEQQFISERRRDGIAAARETGTKAGTAIAVPRVLARFVLKYTLSAGHPQLGGVYLDLAVEDDVFHSIRLTRMDDEFGSNGKSSVAAICEISQACRLTMKARISVPGSGAGGKRWHPKQARFCPEETHVCSGHFGLTCDISDSDVINGVCLFRNYSLPPASGLSSG